jgi:hypothetical protein
MQRRGGIVLTAALVVFGGACGSGGGETEAFELTGRVVSVEPAAQPADAPEGETIVGAIVVQTDEPAECETDANGVRVYLSDDASVTPARATDDLDELRGKTVSVSGEVTKDGDTCTVIADAVTTQSASPAADDDDDDGTDTGDGGGGGAGGGAATPSATDGADATSSPNDPDDEGSIGDTEETASPAPDDPDDEGVVPQP